MEVSEVKTLEFQLVMKAARKDSVIIGIKVIISAAIINKIEINMFTKGLNFLLAFFASSTIEEELFKDIIITSK